MKDSKYLISLSNLSISYNNLRNDLSTYLRTYNNWDSQVDGSSTLHLLDLMSMTSQRLKVIEQYYSDCQMDLFSKITKRVVIKKYPEFLGSSIPVTEFLRCFFYSSSLKSNAAEDLILSDSTKLPVSYEVICAINSEKLAPSVVDQALNHNGKLFIG